MSKIRFKTFFAICLMAIVLPISSPVSAQDFGGEPDPGAFEGPSYSPYARDVPDRVFWGDTHLHPRMLTASHAERRSPPRAAFG